MHTYAQIDNHRPASPVTIRRFSSIPNKPLDWLWQPLIPRGRLTLLAGDPGTGKTSLALYLAAHLSRGEELPHLAPRESRGACVAPPPSTTAHGHPDSPTTSHESRTTSHEQPRPPQATLLLSPDDNPSDTLRPRLEALNANLDLIHTLPDFHSLIPARTANKETPPPHPLELLDGALSFIGNVGLLVIDSINYYLGLTDRALPATAADALDTTTRSTLHALATLAEKHNIAILLTTRLTKSIPNFQPGTSSTTPLHRTLGSLAFSTTARSVLLLTPLPQSPAVAGGAAAAVNASHPPQPHRSPSVSGGSSPTRTPGTPPAHAATQPLPHPAPNSEFPHSPILNSPTHLLLPLKSNLTHLPLPLPYTLTDTITFHTPRTLADLTPPKPAPIPKPPGPHDLIAQSAADWLRLALADGPVLAFRIAKDAKLNSIPIATLNRAKQIAGIESVKQDWSSKWFWKLPNDTRPLPENATEKAMARCTTQMLKLDNLEANLHLAELELDNLAEKSPPRRKTPKTPKIPEKNRPITTPPHHPKAQRLNPWAPPLRILMI